MSSGLSNYAVFAIPAYYVLAFVPHIYATGLLKASKTDAAGKLKQGQRVFNLANPRSADNAQKYSTALDKAVFYKWERARAAHSNLFENAPFVVGAIILGVYSKLPADFLNNACLAYLATRVLYLISYIGVARGPLALARTFWFMIGNGILAALFWKAGVKVMNGEI